MGRRSPRPEEYRHMKRQGPSKEQVRHERRPTEDEVKERQIKRNIAEIQAQLDEYNRKEEEDRIEQLRRLNQADDDDIVCIGFKPSNGTFQETRRNVTCRSFFDEDLPLRPISPEYIVASPTYDGPVDSFDSNMLDVPPGLTIRRRTDEERRLADEQFERERMAYMSYSEPGPSNQFYDQREPRVMNYSMREPVIQPAPYFPALFKNDEEFRVEPVPVYPTVSPEEEAAAEREQKLEREKAEKERARAVARQAEEIKKAYFREQKLEKEKLEEEQRRERKERKEKERKEYDRLENKRRTAEREKRHSEDVKKKKEEPKTSSSKPKEQMTAAQHALMVERDKMFLEALKGSLGSLTFTSFCYKSSRGDEWSTTCHVANIPKDLISSKSTGRSSRESSQNSSVDKFMEKLIEFGILPRELRDSFIKSKTIPVFMAGIMENFINDVAIYGTQISVFEDDPQLKQKFLSFVKQKCGAFMETKKSAIDLYMKTQMEEITESANKRKDHERDRSRERRRDRSRSRERRRRRSRDTTSSTPSPVRKQRRTQIANNLLYSAAAALASKSTQPLYAQAPMPMSNPPQYPPGIILPNMQPPIPGVQGSSMNPYAPMYAQQPPPMYSMPPPYQQPNYPPNYYQNVPPPPGISSMMPLMSIPTTDLTQNGNSQANGTNGTPKKKNRGTKRRQAAMQHQNGINLNTSGSSQEESVDLFDDVFQ